MGDRGEKKQKKTQFSNTIPPVISSPMNSLTFLRSSSHNYCRNLQENRKFTINSGRNKVAQVLLPFAVLFPPLASEKRPKNNRRSQETKKGKKAKTASKRCIIRKIN